MLCILGSIILLLIHFFYPSQQSEQSPYIFQPTYQQHEVYHINYTIINSMAEGYFLRINYTIYLVTASSVERNGEMTKTIFEGSMQKRSQEKISPNKQIENVQLFDNSTLFDSILKDGFNQSDIHNQVKKIQSSNLLAYIFENNSETKAVTTLIKDNNKPIQFFRTFFKMITPKLSQQAYVDCKKCQMGIKSSSNLKSSSNNKTNAQNLNESISYYRYQKNQRFITLYETTKINVKSDIQNTQQLLQQQISFQKGKLSKGFLSSTVTFQQASQQNMIQDDLLNLQPTVFNQNFTLQQRFQFKVIQTFVTNHFQEFAGTLQAYKALNITKTTNIQDLTDQVMEENTTSGNFQLNPLNKNLLYEDDGSLKNIENSKKIKLLKTNILGFNLQVFGYFQHRMKILQDSKNNLKKNITFLTGVGTIFLLGNTQYKYSLDQYKKQLTPLNLQFTLKQIQSAIDLIKEDFITQLLSIRNAIFNGCLEGQLLPQIQSIFPIIKNLTTSIAKQIIQSYPNSKLNQIYQTIQVLSEIYQRKGLIILHEKNETINNLATELLQYVNMSYGEAFNLFQEKKENLKKLSKLSATLFLKLNNVFINQTLQQVAFQINNMITQQIDDNYNIEIRKAKTIFEMIDYYIIESKNYINNITQAVGQHKQNILRILKNVIGLYLNNQDFIPQNIEVQFSRFYQMQKKSYENYASKLQNIGQFATKNSEQIFESMPKINLYFRQYHNNFTKNMTSLTNYSKGAKLQRQQCCKYSKIENFFQKCSNYNEGFFYQGSLPGYWDDAKEISNQSIINATKVVQTFVSSLTQLLQDNITTQDKFSKFQTSYYDTLGKYLLNKTLISEALSNCESQAQGALNKVGCGATDNLRNFIAMIKDVQHCFSQYYYQYEELNKKALKILDEFKVYKTLKKAYNLTVLIVDLMKEQIQQVQKAKSDFIELKKISQNFVKNEQVATKIFTKYQNVKDNVGQLCQQTIFQIDNIQRQYELVIKSLSQLSSTFFVDDIDKITNHPNIISTDTFQEFKDTPFCHLRQFFQEKLYSDFYNFTILQNIWSRFIQIQNQIDLKLKKFENQSYEFRNQFNQLFTRQDYDKLIKNINGNASQFQKQSQYVRLEFSHIKEISKKNIIIFETPTQQELKNCYQSFIDLQFTFDSQSMFKKLPQYTSISQQQIQKVDFDAITIVIASNNIQQHFFQTVQNYKIGIKNISEEFDNICQKFIQLDKFTTLNHLNDIDKHFKKIMNIINETIFPNVTTGLQLITNKFGNYTFKNQKMKNIFDNNMNLLEMYTKLVNLQQKEVYEKFHLIYSQAYQLIKPLQIDSLHSLYELALLLRYLSQSQIALFKQAIQKLKSFPTYVEDDFKNLYKLDFYLERIQNDAEEAILYASIYIKQQIKNKMVKIQNNRNFYQKFRNSKQYVKMEYIAKQRLELDIKQIFIKDAEIISQIESIKSITQQVSGDLQQKLQRITEIQTKVLNIQPKVQKRITKIQQSLSQVKIKIFSLLNLVFVNFHKEFTVISEDIEKISQNIDLIVQQQFASLKYLSDHGIENSSIQQLVASAIFKYNKIKQLKNIFQEQTTHSKKSIEEFLQTNLSKKMQKLKDGSLYIRSLPNRQYPNENAILYNKVFQAQNIPIKYVKTLQTLTNRVKFILDLNISLNCEVLIELVQFRKINITTNLTISVMANTSYDFNIAQTVEFGFFMQGNLLKANVKPKFLIQNAVPFQFVKEIEGIELFQKINKIDLYFIVDVNLNSTQLIVGHYVRDILLQFNQQIINLCINKLYNEQCINFSIPITLKSTLKQEDYSHVVTKQALNETRIIDLHLLSFTY